MGKLIVLITALLLSGCAPEMTYQEKIQAIRMCHSVGGKPWVNLNPLFQPYIECYPKGQL